MTTQAAIKARARDGGTDKLVGDGQQIIQRQQQRLTPLDHDCLLRGRQARVETMPTVRGVLGAGASTPLQYRLMAQPIALG